MTDAANTGKRQNSNTWIKGAFTLINPSDFISEIICIDDCDNCPLFQKGCAGKCPRWDNLVCSGCPCLGSKYSDRSEVITVHPDTLEPEPADEKLKKIRELRMNMLDGQVINPKVLQ